MPSSEEITEGATGSYGVGLLEDPEETVPGGLETQQRTEKQMHSPPTVAATRFLLLALRAISSEIPDKQLKILVHSRLFPKTDSWRRALMSVIGQER